jgi:fucose permease
VGKSGDCAKEFKISEALRIKGVKQVLLAFFAYCALESTAGLWASSYLVLHRGIDADAAARWASLFYLGITVGRFLGGFVTEKIGDRNMIRTGLGIIAVGILAVILPVRIELLPLTGLVLIGLGCAPVYPCIIHETPGNFGPENSQAIIGIQMACAYTGSTLMPPIFGFLADLLSISLYPIYLSLFLVMILIMSERLNRLVASK